LEQREKRGVLAESLGRHDSSAQLAIAQKQYRQRWKAVAGWKMGVDMSSLKDGNF
jgi:hypothetical protein